LPAVQITGPEAAAFVIAANTCTAPSEPCTIQIKFAPTKDGSSSAKLSIVDGQTTATVALHGQGLAASVAAPFAAMPVALDFGQVTVGQTSSPLTITVTTPSARTLTASLSDSAVSEIAIVKDTCTGSLIPANGTCTISLTYTPNKLAYLNGALNITDGTAVVAVTLAGEGWSLL